MADLLTEMRAVAECDELSTAFASIARAMGVRHAGPFWPTSATLGTRGFDPSRQRTICDYVTKQLPLRSPLASEGSARLVAPLPQTILPAATLQTQRNARARELGGS